VSLHMSIVAIEGNRLADFPAIWRRFQYEPSDKPMEGATWETATKRETPETKAVCYLDGWTVILDPELVMMTEDAACAALSAEMSARIVGVLSEGVSASYGFNVFSGGHQIRGFLAVDGDTVEDTGAPLPEEDGIDKQAVSEPDMLAVLAKFGVHYDRLEKCDEFVVWKLDYPEDDAPEPGDPMESTASVEKKPWWKF